MKRIAGRYLLLGLFFALAVRDASPAVAAQIVIQIVDPPGRGFHDPEPRSPVGLNSGTTLGEQRQIAFAHAAALWGDLLASRVPIVVEARFDSLACGSSSAALGFAGPSSSFSDFVGAPRPATLYPSALADSLAGVDLDPGRRDIVAAFNSDIDSGCFRNGIPDGWYYGLDGLPGVGQIDFMLVLLHELAHGLGFSTTVDTNSGRRCCSSDDDLQFDDPFMMFLEDHDSGLSWPEMTSSQRRSSARDAGDLHWIGPRVRAAGAKLSRGATGDHVHMYAPRSHDEGSSVVHFSDTLRPHELLEPFFQPSVGREITEALLRDIGWRLEAGDGDANCDGRTTVADISAVALALSSTGCGGADVDASGTVDIVDVDQIIADLGAR